MNTVCVDEFSSVSSKFEAENCSVPAVPATAVASEAIRFLEALVNQDSGTYDRDDVNALAEMLAGPLRERLLATGRAFWRYRVALHDAALRALL